MLKLCIYNTSNSSKWSFKENNSQTGLMGNEIISPLNDATQIHQNIALLTNIAGKCGMDL